ASQADGSWTVRFGYRPRTFGLGCAVFVATLAGIALVFARARRAALLALPLATLGCSGEPPRHVVDRMHGPTAPASAACDPARAPFRFPTAKGDLCISPLEHAGFVLGWNGQAFYVDPTYGGAVIADEARPALDDDTLPRASYILLTHAHADHLDSVAVSRLEEGVTIFGPPEVNARMHVNEVLREGDTRDLGSFGVTAVPMYNVSRGPAPGLVYHPRGRGIGYLLDLAGTHVYVSGDTDCTAEVRALRGVDVAIVAMDGRTTMSPGEAAQCLLEMRPRVVIPVHDWEADLGELRRALDGSGIELRELPFYPRPERLRVSAVRACDEGHWGRCVELLDLAQQLDPRSDQDPRVVRAREEALRRLNPLPVLH
ncbi:MAG TPA: MBL fold metallo-hydrolase, partial [Polyangiaceae bacterium]